MRPSSTTSPFLKGWVWRNRRRPRPSRRLLPSKSRWVSDCRGSDLPAHATGRGVTDPADEVWAALATVLDPELDEPITMLGFVESHSVVDGVAPGRRPPPPLFFPPALFLFSVAG